MGFKEHIIPLEKMYRKRRIKINRRIKRIIAAIVALIVLFAVLPCAAYGMSFSRYDQEPYKLNDGEAIEFSIDSEGETLKGLLFQARASRTLIVIAPGFHAGLKDYYPIITYFLQNRYSVFYFDPLGSCMSEGESAIGFSRELIDLENVIDFVNSKHRFGSPNLVLFGHSRGGYAACCALENKRVNAVISVSGINSAMEGIIEPIEDKVSYAAYLGWPVLWLYNTILFGRDYTNICAAKTVHLARTPTLLVQGTDDETAPIDGDSIVAHKDEINTKYVEYFYCDKPGQNGHTDLLFDDDGTANDELMKRITDFLNENAR